jgi:hypothetical protein
VYKNYLKRKQIEWKETAKEKEKEKEKKRKQNKRSNIYQPGLEVPALEVVLEAHSISVNKPGTKGRTFSPG